MENKKNPQSKKKRYNEYVKYSGLTFQLLAAILIGYFIGDKIDQYFSMDTPVFTIVFSLLFVMASIVLLIRELLKK